MKKTIFVIVTLLAVMMTQAKERTIKVNGHPTNIKGNTEVFVDNTGYSDSIIITPAQDVSDICVTVKSVYGDVINQCVMPASLTNEVEINTPDLPEGCIIEVEDNSGVIYTDIE